jgi:AcrR family transcriptional regulator
MEAAFASCGAIGYLNTSVADIIAAAGRSRTGFHRLFNSKADCFEQAYEHKMDWLLAEMLDAAGHQCNLYASLIKLADFTVREPLQAGGLLVQGKFAEGAPPVRGRATIKRLGRPWTTVFVRRPGPMPPALAGEFSAAAIESLVCSALIAGRPDEFADRIPEIVAFVCMIYGLDHR